MAKPLDQTMAAGYLLAALLIVPESILGVAWFPAGAVAVAAAGVVLTLLAWPTRRWVTLAIVGSIHAGSLTLATVQITDHL